MSSQSTTAPAPRQERLRRLDLVELVELKPEFADLAAQGRGLKDGDYRGYDILRRRLHHLLDQVEDFLRESIDRDLPHFEIFHARSRLPRRPRK